MREKSTTCNVDIETTLSEVSNVENYICSILENENFDGLNYLKGQNSLNSTVTINDTIAQFVAIDVDSLAPYSNLISEKEFFRIVGSNGRSVYKRSGHYQESLFSNYLKAQEEQDKGYIEDVLRKAIVFEYNLTYVKALSENKKFMREWRKNFGKISPIFEFKNSGSLKKINTVKNLIE